MDLVYIAGLIACAGLCAALVPACQRLRRGPGGRP